MTRRGSGGLHRATAGVLRRLGLRHPTGGELLYLTTVGRRTGKKRTTPLLHLDDEGRWIVAAANAGAEHEPGWWLNLQAGTGATVEVDGRSVPVVGTEVTGEERDELWRRLNEAYDYEAYQAEISRRIAVVALTPLHIDY